METKRKVSILIPYKIKGYEILAYLQKRSKDAERLPDYFGFFGGGAEEGESPEEALRREIKEELNFVPENHAHFKRYEFERSIKDIFLMQADPDFERKITILEGEYGKWFTEQEMAEELKLIDEDKIVLRDVYKSLCLTIKT